MRRLTAMFVAVCMVLMAASLGAILFLAAGLPAVHAAIVALAALMCFALYNAITTRLRDRTDLGDQIADLSRGTSDLARQVAEIARRLAAMEERVDSTVNRARGALDPIAAEIGELGGLVKQLAETVAIHDSKLGGPAALADPAAAGAAPLLLTTEDIAPQSAPAAERAEPNTGTAAPVDSGRFGGMSRDAIVALISSAVEAHRVDLYLQPIVTLPQRKVRYYEAMSRLRLPDGEVLPADDFIDYAESGGLMPRIDNLLLFRCVQVVRRLLLKNRDVGLFCNVSMATLTDPAYFRQLHDFMQANRALAPSLVFEFRHGAYRAFGAIEHEGLAALADLGFRFSLDHVSDLRLDPRELFERGFRFMKVPAKLLLNKAAGVQSDIDPADLANLLARSSIDLIAERIESETMVVDLLDYDVKFGQGFLFSPPRPVRPEALHASAPPPTPPQIVDDAAAAMPSATPTVAASEAPAPGTTPATSSPAASSPAAGSPAAGSPAMALEAPDFVRQNVPAA